MVDGSDLFNKGVMNQRIVAVCLGDENAPVSFFSAPTSRIIHEQLLAKSSHWL